MQGHHFFFDFPFEKFFHHFLDDRHSIIEQGLQSGVRHREDLKNSGEIFHFLDVANFDNQLWTQFNLLDVSYEVVRFSGVSQLYPGTETIDYHINDGLIIDLELASLARD